ncbi:hypothetical protein ACJX0J_012015, partial [Zea mays]
NIWILICPKNTQDANWVMIQDSSQEWKRAIPGMIQDSSQEWKRAIYLQVTINKYTTLELFSLDKLIINVACIAVKMIQDSSQEWKRNAAYLVHQGLIFCHFFWILLLSNAAYLVIWTPQICMFRIFVAANGILYLDRHYRKSPHTSRFLTDMNLHEQ